MAMKDLQSVPGFLLEQISLDTCDEKQDAFRACQVNEIKVTMTVISLSHYSRINGMESMKLMDGWQIQYTE
jgi:hypothetical protein